MKAIVLAGPILLTLSCLLLLWSSYDWNQTRSQSPLNHSAANLAMTFAYADHAQQQRVKGPIIIKTALGRAIVWSAIDPTRRLPTGCMSSFMVCVWGVLWDKIHKESTAVRYAVAVPVTQLINCLSTMIKTDRNFPNFH
ncbi:MAG: hypothetical protein ACI9WC_003335 [Arenicella sp.]|jgi:hypothetical protein